MAGGTCKSHLFSTCPPPTAGEAVIGNLTWAGVLLPSLICSNPNLC